MEVRGGIYVLGIGGGIWVGMIFVFDILSVCLESKLINLKLKGKKRKIILIDENM